MDATSLRQQWLPGIILVITLLSTTSAQLQGRPPWELTYQIEPSSPSSSPQNAQYQLLPQEQVVSQQRIVPQQHQQQIQQPKQPQQQQEQQPQQLPTQPNSPITYINSSPNPYREYPIDIPKASLQRPQTIEQPQNIPNPQVQSSQHVPQQVPLQNLHYFEQPQLYNFQPYSTEQEQTYEPKLAPQFNSFSPPLPPPAQLNSNPVYSQTQNQIHQIDDLQQKLQLQLQITQQIQQQIEQLQKLQELNRQSINQQRKFIDQGKLETERGSASQQRQPIYQRVDQQNQQALKSDNQEIYTQQSLIPQSTISNLQFASPVNAIQRPPHRFVPSQVFLDNVTDPSLPYYLVAPSLNSVSFFDRLRNGGLEGRAFLPYTFDLTTELPNVGTVTPPGVYGESTTTVTSNEVHTQTELANSSESTERNGVDSETVTAQRRSQSEVTTTTPRVARERIQNTIRKFVARG